jgi:hypothetical protein
MPATIQSLTQCHWNREVFALGAINRNWRLGK